MNPRGYNKFSTISEIHYNQLHFHSRTFTGSHMHLFSMCAQIHDHCKSVHYSEFPLHVESLPTAAKEVCLASLVALLENGSYE